MQSEQPDAELVLAAQAGDTISLSLVLERHRASMHAVALTILGYRPEAEDVVQDSMLIALRRIGELRDASAVGSWLRAIVRNACRMHLRAAPAETIAEPSIRDLPSHEPSPEELLDRQALRDWIWHALDELSPPLRLTALLRYFSDVSSYEQIAALCGVPVGTVRSRLNQVRRKLADALLMTAGLAHASSAPLTVARRQEFAELLSMAERGAFAAALAGRWSPDAEIVLWDGRTSRGLDLVIRIMDGDLEDGVHQRLVNVVASRDLTIIEAALLSPPDDPNHCPPGLVWLQTLHGDRVERLRLFHPRTSQIDRTFSAEAASGPAATPARREPKR
jgi:RNA polymerase sigma-70 factor (ECF subfamily)